MLTINPISVAAFRGKTCSPKQKQAAASSYSMPQSLSFNGLNAVSAYNRAGLRLVNFKGSKDALSFENFNKIRLQAGVLRTEDIEENITPENLLGTGLNSEVYAFNDPNLKNWAIKVDKKPDKNYDGNPNFKPVKDDFEGLNKGQEIAKIGDRYHILKRINGEPHSIADWSAHINGGSKVSKEEAKTFAKNLETLAGFDDKFYDDYAEQVKVLEDKGYKMDSINPNNLLIDYDDEKIYVIDYFKKADPSHINSALDLSACILDFSLFKNFHGALDSEEGEKLIENAKIIDEKCRNAAVKAGLKDDEETYLNYIANVDKWFGFFLEDKGGNYNSRYQSLVELIG